MYGQVLYVGASSVQEVEEALGRVLPELGIVILERDTLERGRYHEYIYNRSRLALARAIEPFPEAPSIALSRTSEVNEVVNVYVRGPRLPLWHIALAQRLSRELGAWAMLLVNDRLFDDYGRGFFLCGHPIESASVFSASKLLMFRFGIDPRTSDSAVRASLDEDANRRRFDEITTEVAERNCASGLSDEPRVLCIAAADGRSSYAVDDDARRSVIEILDGTRARPSPTEFPWVAVPETARTIGVLADLTEEGRASLAKELGSRGFAIEPIDLDPTYGIRPDGVFDEDPNLMLTLSADYRRADAVRDAIARVPCLAAIAELEGGPEAVRNGAVAAWSRAKGGAFQSHAGYGPEILTSAWSLVTSRTDLPPVRWRFGRPPLVVQAEAFEDSRNVLLHAGGACLRLLGLREVEDVRALSAGG